MTSNVRERNSFVYLPFKEPICNEPEILQLIKKLRNDSSKDVKNLMFSINIPEESVATKDLVEPTLSDHKSSQETTTSGQNSEKVEGLSQEDGEEANKGSNLDFVTCDGKFFH